MNIAVSCVIPTVRGGEKLSRAVRSVLSQELDSELEVIVVNDMGYDSDIRFGDWQSDKRVKIITTNKVECCFARNVGASIARGKYLHFLDDDDYMLPGAYSALLGRAEESGSAWTYGFSRIVDDNGNQTDKFTFVFEGDCYGLIFVGGFNFSLMISFIRREVFLEKGGFDSGLIPGQDYDLTHRILRDYNIACVPREIAVLRVDNNGSTTTPWFKESTNLKIIREKQFACHGFVKRVLLGMKPCGKYYGLLCGRFTRFFIGSAARHIKTAPLISLSRIFASFVFVFRGFFRNGFIDGLRGKYAHDI